MPLCRHVHWSLPGREGFGPSFRKKKLLKLLKKLLNLAKIPYIIYIIILNTLQEERNHFQ